jgi:hypothetical protein
MIYRVYWFNTCFSGCSARAKKKTRPNANPPRSKRPKTYLPPYPEMEVRLPRTIPERTSLEGEHPGLRGLPLRGVRQRGIKQVRVHHNPQSTAVKHREIQRTSRDPLRRHDARSRTRRVKTSRTARQRLRLQTQEDIQSTPTRRWLPQVQTTHGQQK